MRFRESFCRAAVVALHSAVAAHENPPEHRVRARDGTPSGHWSRRATEASGTRSSKRAAQAHPATSDAVRGGIRGALRARPTPMWFGRISAAIALLAPLAMLGGCSSHAPGLAKNPPIVREGDLLVVPSGSPLRQRLAVQPVEMRTAPHLLTVPATVTADPTDVAKVLPAVSGRVLKLYVNLGDTVHRGELLAVMGSGGMAQAYADAAKARAALQLARTTLTRTRAVEQGGGAAVKDVQAARNAYEQARAEYRRAEAALLALGGAATGAPPGPAQVRAPIRGTVTALSVAPGVFVNDPTVPLLIITDTRHVWVTAEVPQDELRFVARGAAARVSLPADPGRVFRGSVDTVGTVVDPATGRDPVRIRIANPDGALKPNMFATAAIAVAQPPQVFVPQSALLMNNDSTTVFVEVAPWEFARRTVELSYDEGPDARVLKGLRAGEHVIVRGGVLLNDD